IDYTNAPAKIDPFLYSTEPRRWVADQWLSDLLLYKLYELNGWEILYKTATILFFLLFCVAGVLTVKQNELSLAWGLIAVLLALRLSLVHFILRPVLLSICLFGLLYFYLA